MKCKSCGQDNKGERRYCGKCGMLLRMVCPACGFENEENDIFCGGCGGDLGAKAPSDKEKRQDSKASSASGVSEAGKPVIDSARLLNMPEEKKTEESAGQSKAKQEKEKQKKENQDKAKMDQEDIQQLFEEKEKNKKEAVQEGARLETKPKEKDKARYVDKSHPSVLDSPITQGELDKLFEEYEKKQIR